MLAFALCFVLLKQNKLVMALFCNSLEMPSLAENIGKIISVHSHGPKIKKAPRPVNNNT